MNIDQSKVTVHYLNGLAVAVVATLGDAYLAGKVPIGLLVIGALTSNWYGWPKNPKGGRTCNLAMDITRLVQ